MKIFTTIGFVFFVSLCQGQWSQLKGPIGGTVRCLLQISDTTYAGTIGGVFYSTDLAVSWKPLSSGLFSYCSVQAICYGNGNLYLFSDSTGYNSVGGRVYKMHSGGNQWTQIGNQNAPFAAMSVAGDYICIGSNTAYLYQSNNGGSSWTYGPSAPANNCSSLYASGDTTYFSGTYYRVGTGSWINMNGMCSGATVMYKYQSLLYTGDWYGIHSENTGCNFIFGNTSSNNYITAITSNDDNLCFSTVYNGVYVYSTLYNTWLQQNVGLTTYNVWDLVYKNGVLIAGTGNGVFRSVDNGLNWTEADSGLVATIPLFAVHDSVFVSICYGEYSKSYTRSLDEGNFWIQIPTTSFSSTPMYSVITNGKDFFMGGDEYSLNNGATWTYNPPAGNFGGMSHGMLADSGIVYSGGGSYLYFSDDTLTTWQHHSSIGNIVSIGKQGGTIYVALSSSSSHAYKTSNKGVTWQQTNFPGNTYYMSIVSLGDYVYYGRSTGGWIYRSGDGGATVTQIDSGNIHGGLSCMYVYKDKYLFAGSNTGVYFSPDSGRTWLLENDGLENKRIFEIAGNEDEVFISVYGNGICKRSATDFDSIAAHWYLNAQFSSSDTLHCGSGCVNFVNESIHADSCHWFFPGGIPSFSISSNPPTVCYNNPGSYDVSLIAFRNITQDTFFLQGFITVSSPIQANANESGGEIVVQSSGTIQWYDCATQQIIAGETGNVFVPTVSGNYAAIVTEGSCTDTSECILFFTGINSNSISNIPFSFYPNPASKNITVEYSITVSGTVTICNLLGEHVQEISLEKNTTKKTVAFTNIPSGIYFCVMKTSDGKMYQQKLVVQ